MGGLSRAGSQHISNGLSQQTAFLTWKVEFDSERVFTYRLPPLINPALWALELPSTVACRAVHLRVYPRRQTLKPTASPWCSWIDCAVQAPPETRLTVEKEGKPGEMARLKSAQEPDVWRVWRKAGGMTQKYRITSAWEKPLGLKSCKFLVGHESEPRAADQQCKGPV